MIFKFSRTKPPESDITPILLSATCADILTNAGLARLSFFRFAINLGFCTIKICNSLWNCNNNEINVQIIKYDTLVPYIDGSKRELTKFESSIKGKLSWIDRKRNLAILKINRMSSVKEGMLVIKEQ
ncbi:hypothetical protein L0128_05895 [candidate division KSB1 bacterium]|nr:hypothetical protein [candidate division KSB1 bacterium]